MIKPTYTDIDLMTNKLMHAVIHPLDYPPDNPKVGQAYFDMQMLSLGIWIGNRWDYYKITTIFQNWTMGETPAGTIDGSNATFTTHYAFTPGYLEARINGLYQRPTIDFITLGYNTIIFTDSPGVGDEIIVNYINN